MTARYQHLRRGYTAGLTLLTLAALLSGCTAGTPAQPGATTPAPAQSTATATSTASAAASSTPAGTGWTALKDSAPFQALTPEQQSKISALEAMDTATFEKQTRDDQLAYGAFLREVYQDFAVAESARIAPDVSLPTAKKVSISSAGAEIVNDEMLKAATARWSLQPGSDLAAADPGAGSNYTKMAPSRVSPIFPAAFEKVSQPSEMTGEAVAFALPDSKGAVIVGESNNFIPFDGTWEQLPFKIVQMQDPETQALNQLYFAYTPFTDIHGTKDGVWVVMQNVAESQEKWIPDLSVID